MWCRSGGLAALALAASACQGVRKEGEMSSVRFQELYSGAGGIAGRSEWMVVVHSPAAWRRLAPALQGQRTDWEALPIDWKGSVALVIRAPPAGNAAQAFHVAAITRMGNEVDVEVEQRAIPGREGPSTWSAVPVMNPSLIVAEADAAAFSGAASVRVRVPGVAQASVAQER